MLGRHPVRLRAGIDALSCAAPGDCCAKIDCASARLRRRPGGPTVRGGSGQNGRVLGASHDAILAVPASNSCRMDILVGRTYKYEVWTTGGYAANDGKGQVIKSVAGMHSLRHGGA